MDLKNFTYTEVTGMKLMFNLLSPLLLLIVLIGLFDVFLLKHIKAQNHATEQTVTFSHDTLAR
jgi:hypothetical protein